MKRERDTSRRRLPGTILALTLLYMLLGGATTAPAGACIPGVKGHVCRPHEALVSPGVVALNEGEILQIGIQSTVPECFSYNYKSIEIKEDLKKADRPQIPLSDFDFPPIVHDGKDRDYQVFVQKRGGLDASMQAACKPHWATLPERGEKDPWVIPVRTYGWTIGFAGGFTIDGLTDPVFALRADQREVDGETQDGFTVFEQSGAEDDYTLGAAAMIHVFHTNPANPKWRRWAPVSFGLAVQDGTDVRYFLGTSLRFGKEFFLTGGLTFGSIDRLPNGLDLADNNFTMDSNALQNLGSRSEPSFFIGVSYSFLGDKKPFQNALSTAAPSAGATTGQAAEKPAAEKPAAEKPAAEKPAAAGSSGPLKLSTENPVGERSFTNPLSEEVKILTVAVTHLEGGTGTFKIEGCAGETVGPSKSCALKITFEPGDGACRNASVTIVTEKGEGLAGPSLEGNCPETS